MNLVGFYIAKGEAPCVNIKDVSSAEAQMRAKFATTGTGLSNCSMCSITVSRRLLQNCGYSELYNKQSSTAGNILDLFFGG
ncbi:zinc ribbon domain-containing protein [Bacillus licheniformis]|nr:zinc ribbon domain-containing protein [Bacillus licheniformis]